MPTRFVNIVFKSPRQIQESISLVIKDNLLYENCWLDVKDIKIIKSLTKKTTKVRARHP